MQISLYIPELQLKKSLFLSYFFFLYKNNMPKFTIKKFFFEHIRMKKLLLNELKPIAASRGVNDYENKSEKDLIKILS